MKRNICPFQNTDYQHSNFCEKKNQTSKTAMAATQYLCTYNQKKNQHNIFPPMKKTNN